MQPEEETETFGDRHLPRSGPREEDYLRGAGSQVEVQTAGPYRGAPNLTLQGDQPKDWRATNPKTAGRPAQTLAGADPRTRISLLPRSSTPNARLFRRMSKNHTICTCFHHSPVGLHLAAARPSIARPEKRCKTCTNHTNHSTNHPQTIGKNCTNHTNH